LASSSFKTWAQTAGFAPASPGFASPRISTRRCLLGFRLPASSRLRLASRGPVTVNHTNRTPVSRLASPGFAWLRLPTDFYSQVSSGIQAPGFVPASPGFAWPCYGKPHKPHSCQPAGFAWLRLASAPHGCLLAGFFWDSGSWLRPGFAWLRVALLW
jgi:hypothetical protein